MEGGKLSMANTLFNYDELSNLSEQERKLALEILKEYSQKGCSEQFNKILYEDYEEIPVDIETFLYEPKYLGRGLVNSEGKMTVFPYWIKTLKKLFPDPLQPSAYNTLALSGAIGLGKSFVATICLLYELYRMMCLKDPYLHYGLQPIDKITFAFLNITLDAAKGVAWSKCQELLQSSDWFMSKGTLSKSDSPQWIPPKGIELICGSKSGHILGRAVYACLDGDTIIRTSNGDMKISDCVDKEIRVFNYKEGHTVETPPCTVKPTTLSDEEYQIELEDGTVIKCTGNHQFLLTNGKYVEAQYLSETDEIVDFPVYGYVYKTTNTINGKIYIGQKASSNFLSNDYLGSGKILKAAIKKYGRDAFTVECLELCRDKTHLDMVEKRYITQFNSTDCTIGYNIACGGQGGNLGITVNRKISDKLKGANNPMYGTHWDDEKRKEFSQKSTDAWKSEEKRKLQSDRLRGMCRTPETKKKLSEAVNRRYREAPETFKNGLLGKIAITNGSVTKYVSRDVELEAGWYHGSATKGKHFKAKTEAWTAEKRKQLSIKNSAENNPMYGKGYLLAGGRNGHANKIYTYNEKDFMCRNDLKSYLNSIGYNVTNSSLRSLVDVSEKNHSRTYRKFPDLVNKITWRYKNEN